MTSIDPLALYCDVVQHLLIRSMLCWWQVNLLQTRRSVWRKKVAVRHFCRPVSSSQVAFDFWCQNCFIDKDMHNNMIIPNLLVGKHYAYTYGKQVTVWHKNMHTIDFRVIKKSKVVQSTPGQFLRSFSIATQFLNSRFTEVSSLGPIHHYLFARPCACASQTYA